MTNQLHNYIQILKEKLDSNVGSRWIVDSDGKRFCGLFIDCPSIISDITMDAVREIIGDGYSISYLPNQQEIIIE